MYVLLPSKPGSMKNDHLNISICSKQLSLCSIVRVKSPPPVEKIDCSIYQCTLDSEINIGVHLFGFGFFSGATFLIREGNACFFQNILCLMVWGSLF